LITNPKEENGHEEDNVPPEGTFLEARIRLGIAQEEMKTAILAELSPFLQRVLWMLMKIMHLFQKLRRRIK